MALSFVNADPKQAWATSVFAGEAVSRLKQGLVVRPCGGLSRRAALEYNDSLLFSRPSRVDYADRMTSNLREVI